jgi:hypothetical protein
MTEQELIEVMLELANELELEVRVAGSAPTVGSEAPLVSAVCRLKGRLWVVLSSADPASAQIEALARGLRLQGGPALEERYLAPALREVLALPGD